MRVAITSIKHLHQLQNLVQLLTGTELTITPIKMEKKIQDYIHLYPRCQIIYDDVYNDKSGLTGVVTPKIIEWAIYPEYWGRLANVKPYLRPLSSMTEEEKEYRWNNFFNIKQINQQVVAEEIRWLLSKHFDLFGLIDAGIAIDKTKHPSP